MKHLVLVSIDIIYILCMWQVNAVTSTEYTYLGCYQDGDPNIFNPTYLSLQQSFNSPDFCHQFCVAEKYPFFGLMNGKECWCSRSLKLIQSYGGQVDECKSLCTGNHDNSNPMCGGAESMDIYYTNDLKVSRCSDGESSGNCDVNAGTECSSGFECTYPLAIANVQEDVGICCPTASSNIVIGSGHQSPDYTYLGCYKDGTPFILDTKRKMLQQSFNSPDFCHKFCIMENYPFFGLKNAKECWCSRSLELIQSHGGQVDECKSTCTGDSSTMCGGPEALSLYYTNDLKVSMCSNGDSSRGNCDSVAGPSCPVGYECTYPLANANVQDKAGICCHAASSGYTHLGCYSDGWHLIIQTDRKNLNQPLSTPDHCYDYCVTGKYPFFGLKRGGQCWCIMNLAVVESGLEDSCDSPCSGDPAKQCGGTTALDIYRSDSSEVARCLYGGPSGQCGDITGNQCSSGYQCNYPLANSNVNGQVGLCCEIAPFAYQGCFSSEEPHILNPAVQLDGYYTHHTCYMFCNFRGFSYFGLRGIACYCGADTSHFEKYGAVNEDQCNTPCTGDNNQICVYQIP